MWENRFFFLDREVLADSNYEAPGALARLRELDDPERYAAELAARGVTHVVVHGRQMRMYFDNRFGWDLLHPEVYPPERLRRDEELMSAFLARCLEPAFALGPHGVFRLRPCTPPVATLPSETSSASAGRGKPEATRTRRPEAEPP
jgi:hypothetical protein